MSGGVKQFGELFQLVTKKCESEDNQGSDYFNVS